jgi:hypothetical protein
MAPGFVTAAAAPAAVCKRACRGISRAGDAGERLMRRMAVFHYSELQ